MINDDCILLYSILLHMIVYDCILLYIFCCTFFCCSIVACGGATRHPTLKLDSLPSSPILGVPDTKTGRDLQELVSSRVAAKTGATIALQHDSRPLSLRKSLKEQLCHDGVELNSLSLSHGRWVNRLFSCIFSNHWSESYHALTALVTWPPAMGDACEVVRVPALRYCKRLEFDQGFAGDQRRVCAWRYHSAVWGIADRQIARNASFELAEIVIWWFLQPKLLGEIMRCSIQQKRVLRVTHPHTHTHRQTHPVLQTPESHDFPRCWTAKAAKKSRQPDLWPLVQPRDTRFDLAHSPKSDLRWLVQQELGALQLAKPAEKSDFWQRLQPELERSEASKDPWTPDFRACIQPKFVWCHFTQHLAAPDFWRGLQPEFGLGSAMRPVPPQLWWVVQSAFDIKELA